jgi:AcrR family transcriptional regulator
MREKTTRKRAKQVTRVKLLKMAEQTLVDTDFKASTLSIARRASVAHGTIFFHFKNRDELILSVVRRLVLTMTEKLYAAYVDSHSLNAFLLQHFQTIRAHWRLIKALLAGFSNFSDDVKQEVVALLAVANYYLVESFNRWADKGLVRTTAWQGVIVYLSFFGDYMFEKKNISEEFIQQLLNFLGETKESKISVLPDHTADKKLCESCGMILHEAADFAKQDITSKYCRYCTDKQGSLKSYDEVVETMTTFFEKTQVLNTNAAHKAALAVLAKNPAWKQKQYIQEKN